MIYNFQTKQEEYAVAALIVYAVYRSRDKSKFKISPEMWGQIQRFVKSSAKRAKDIPEFIDNLLPKLSCPSINPKWVEVGVHGRLFKSGDTVFNLNNKGNREFMVEILERADDKEVVKALLRKTQIIIFLVRDRLEAEKPIEATFEAYEEMDEGESL